jgi:hypothetical protein
MIRQYQITTASGDTYVCTGNTRDNALKHWVWGIKPPGIGWRLRNQMRDNQSRLEGGTVEWPADDPATVIRFTITPIRDVQKVIEP